jgi:hypothetical protein
MNKIQIRCHIGICVFTIKHNQPDWDEELRHMVKSDPIPGLKGFGVWSYSSVGGAEVFEGLSGQSTAPYLGPEELSGQSIAAVVEPEELSR